MTTPASTPAPALPADLAGRLAAAGLEPDEVSGLVAAALAEDLGGGHDVTTESTIGAERVDDGAVLAKEAGVIAGLLVAEVVFQHVGGGEVIAGGSREAERVASGDVVMTVRGRTQDLLTAERVALNFTRHLSGVASLTRRYVDAVEGTDAVILDTRKTTPLLRALEKYAVRCGGGTNHRMSLADMALIKDNHVLAAGGVRQAFDRVRAAAGPDLPIEVEVVSLAMAEEAVEAGATRLLLDNMSPADMASCVRAVGDRATLEASGGITLESVRAVAESGVDFISIGALTHSAPDLDLSLDLHD